MTIATKKLVDSRGQTFEELAEQHRLIEEVNEEARERWEDPQWRREVAAELTESILLGFQFETLTDRFIETERTDFNGRIFVRETKGVRAFWTARGGYIEASQLTSESSELPRDMVGVHVSEFEDKLETNFAENIVTLRDLAVRRMDAEVNRRVLALWQEAVPTSSPYYVSTPGISKAAVDLAIRNVADATNSDEIAIVGRPATVDQITDFDGFGNETKEEIRRRGILGIYKGATIVRLRNFKDEDDVAYWPENEMWVVAADNGKVGFYGGMKFKEFTEDDNWFWHYLARRDAGALVHHPERLRRIVDSNI